MQGITFRWSCVCSAPQSSPTLCDPMDCRVPLSMGFSRQEYWSGLPFPPPGDPPDPGIKPMSLASPALASRFSWSVIQVFFSRNTFGFNIDKMCHNECILYHNLLTHLRGEGNLKTWIWLKETDLIFHFKTLKMFKGWEGGSRGRGHTSMVNSCWCRNQHNIVKQLFSN